MKQETKCPLNHLLHWVGPECDKLVYSGTVGAGVYTELGLNVKFGKGVVSYLGEIVEQGIMKPVL